MHVTSADGSPCPAPEPRKRRPRKKSSETGDDVDEGNEGGDEGEKKGGRQPRRRRRQAKKEYSDKDDAWETSLEEGVLTAMDSKGIKVDGGRAFLAIGDARVKLGTDGYAALAHSKAILAEGTWSVEPNGVVSITWERALKLNDDNQWVYAAVEDEKDILFSEIDLSDGRCIISCWF